MIANLGYGALIITFLVALYGIGAALYGLWKHKPAWVDSARNAMLLTFPLLTLSALSIIYLLVTDHYEVEYVANVTSRSHAHVPEGNRTLGWAGWLVDFLVMADVGFRFGSHFAQLGTRSRISALGDRDFVDYAGIFLDLKHFCREPFMRLWQLPSGEVVKRCSNPRVRFCSPPVMGKGSTRCCAILG